MPAVDTAGLRFVTSKQLSVEQELQLVHAVSRLADMLHFCWLSVTTWSKMICLWHKFFCCLVHIGLEKFMGHDHHLLVCSKKVAFPATAGILSLTWSSWLSNNNFYMSCTYKSLTCDVSDLKKYFVLDVWRSLSWRHDRHWSSLCLHIIGIAAHSKIMTIFIVQV